MTSTRSLLPPASTRIARNPTQLAELGRRWLWTKMSGQQSRQTCSNAAVLVLLCCCSWYQPGNSASQAPSTGLNGDAVRSSSGTGGSSGWPGLPLLFGGNLLGSGVVTDAAAATSSSSRRGNQQGNSDSPAATPLLAAPAEDWCGCFPGPGSSEQQTSTATAATAAAATATAMSAAAAALLETPWRLMSADYQHAPQRAAVGARAAGAGAGTTAAVTNSSGGGGNDQGVSTTSGGAAEQAAPQLATAGGMFAAASSFGNNSSGSGGDSGGGRGGRAGGTEDVPTWIASSSVRVRQQCVRHVARAAPMILRLVTAESREQARSPEQEASADVPDA